MYRARDTRTGSEIALKILSSADPSLATSLESEFSILSALSHPNLIGVHDYGISDSGEAYFTMDLLEGKSLGEYLESKEAVARVTDILSGILSALEYLSRRNIVHGDIKPGNIMICGEEEPRPILLDFGLSTLSKRGSQRLSGTPRCMAPEIFGKGHYSPLSDLYALGHTMIECLTGSVTPMAGKLSGEYLQGAYRDLSSVFSEAGIPGARNLASWLLELSEPDPSRRTGSIRAARQKLSLVSRSTAEERIVIESPHVPRKSLEGKIGSFLEERDFGERLLLLEGPLGTGKKTLLAKAVSGAQLAGYAVLDFIDTPGEGFSIQEIIEILCVNLPAQESEELLEQHRHLLENMKRAESESDLENVGVIYSNIVEHIDKLSARRPVLLILPGIESISIDTLKFLRHLEGEAEFLGSRIKVVLSHSSDVPMSDGIGAEIENLRGKASVIKVGGFSLEELEVLCGEIFRQELFTEDELGRILSLTGGNPQFVLDYLDHLVSVKVITKRGGTFFVDHKSLQGEYSAGGYEEIAADILSRLSGQETLLLNLLALHEIPIVLDKIEPLLDIDTSAVVESCERQRFIELDAGSAVLRSSFLRHALVRRLDEETRRKLHGILARYSLANESEDYPRIAGHFIRAGSVEKAFEYGMKAVRKLESSHEYYSAYGILLGLKELTRGNSGGKSRIEVLERIAPLELTLGYLEDSAKDYEELIEIVGDAPPAARYYTSLGDIELRYRGTYEKALEYYGKALTLARRHDLGDIEAASLISMGIARDDVTLMEQAASIAKGQDTFQYIRALCRALVRYIFSGDIQRCNMINEELNKHIESENLILKSSIYDAKYAYSFYTADYETAYRMTEELIKLAKQTCNTREVIRYMTTKAGIHYIQGRFSDQIELLNNAYNMTDKYNINYDLHTIFSNLVFGYMTIAMYSEAINLLRKSQAFITDHKISLLPFAYFSIGAHTLLYVGDLYLKDFLEWIKRLEESAIKSHNKHSLGFKELITGEYQYFNTAFEKASEHFGEALEIFTSLKGRDDMLDALLRLSLAYRQMGDHERAGDYARRGTEIFEQIRCGYLEPLHAFVTALVECDRNPDSPSPLLEAIDTSRRYGTREWTWQIQFELARFHKRSGDISGAVKYAREAINTLREITEPFDDPEMVSPYLEVPLRKQVFEFVKSLKS